MSVCWVFGQGRQVTEGQMMMRHLRHGRRRGQGLAKRRYISGAEVLPLPQTAPGGFPGGSELCVCVGLASSGGGGSPGAMIPVILALALVAGVRGEAVTPSPYLGLVGSSIPLGSKFAPTSSRYALTVHHGTAPRASPVSQALPREESVNFSVDDTTLYREDVGDGPATHEEGSEEVQRRREGVGKSSTRPFHPRVDSPLPPRKVPVAVPSVRKVEASIVPAVRSVQAQVVPVSPVPPASLKVIVPVVPAAVSPLVTPAPQVAVHHEVVQQQFHAQDELGRYAFGYSGGPSSRAETRDALGHVRGSFSYVDPHGKVQYQHYVADDHGFRITSASNVPQQRHRRSAEDQETTGAHSRSAVYSDTAAHPRTTAQSGNVFQQGAIGQQGFAAHSGVPVQSPFALQHFLTAQPNTQPAHTNIPSHPGFPSQSGILVRSKGEAQSADSAHPNLAHLGPVVQTNPGTDQSALTLPGSFAHQPTPVPVGFAVQPVNAAHQGATSFQNAVFQGAVATPSSVAFQGSVARPSGTPFVGSVSSPSTIPFQGQLIHQGTAAQSPFVAVPGSRASAVPAGIADTTGFPSAHDFAGQSNVFGHQGGLTAPGSFTPSGTPASFSGNVALFVASDFLQGNRGNVVPTSDGSAHDPNRSQTTLQGLGTVSGTPGLLASASGGPGLLDILGNQGNSGFSYGFEESPSSVQTFGSHFSPGRQ
ncbi:uncharacterized protein LOC122259775 [Penaeus japonicus]|uniref:uncharacterized protein LOC122259775 n=1 Tax=Penaeus japonicus TaxID=27405 RepID=UPI001C70F77E|nr:uncharacterized protein LOC122259775 [Penaeus japonicus]